MNARRKLFRLLTVELCIHFTLLFQPVSALGKNEETNEGIKGCIKEISNEGTHEGNLRVV